MEDAVALGGELEKRYEASLCVVASKGCLRRERGLGAAMGNQLLVCGAQQGEQGFKTASILYSTGLMTKGGSITLERQGGGLTQVWRVRETGGAEASSFY